MTRLVKHPDTARVLEFCRQEPVERVFLEDVARRGLGRFVALECDEEFLAVCQIGASIVPSGREVSRFSKAVAREGVRMIVGEERAVTELWEAARSRFSRPVDDRPGQPVYVLDRPPAPGCSGLRAAELADLPLLVPACDAAYREEVGIDAHARNPVLSEWRARAQIEQGRSWVWAEHDHILFKAEASAWTDRAVQLQQVWVDPEFRGRGCARRALADLCRELLAKTHVVCLFVRPDNVAALALYESLGMRRTITYRSLIFS